MLLRVEIYMKNTKNEEHKYKQFKTIYKCYYN